MEKPPNQEDSNGTTFLSVFIALNIIVVSYVLSLIKKQSNNREEAGKENRQITSRRTGKLENAEDIWVLVLVINVGKYEMIQSLEEANGKVPENQGDALYRATRFLKICSPAEFSNSKLPNWFNKEEELSKDEPSEYDVYLVKFELIQDDKGFKSNANQIDRLDAFRRLHSIAKSVEVSPRLPSKAYENIGVYSR